MVRLGPGADVSEPPLPQGRHGGGIVSSTGAALTAPPPPKGNIFDRLSTYGISWRSYYSDLPSLAILFNFASANGDKLVPISQFFTDAAARTLPAVSPVDPAFNVGESEENSDDVRVGERFASRVIHSVVSGPGWPKTLLVWLYRPVRRLLRSRPPAPRAPARRHPARHHRSPRPARPVRPLRLPGACRGCVAVRAATSRVAPGA